MSKEQRKQIRERIEEGTLKFIGFISEREIKLNKNKPYLYFITDNSQDSKEFELLLTGKIRNVYVYKEIKKEEN